MSKGCKYCGEKITKYCFDTFFMGKTIIGVCDKKEHRDKASKIIERKIKAKMINAQII